MLTLTVREEVWLLLAMEGVLFEPGSPAEAEIVALHDKLRGRQKIRTWLRSLEQMEPLA